MNKETECYPSPCNNTQHCNTGNDYESIAKFISCTTILRSSRKSPWVEELALITALLPMFTNIDILVDITGGIGPARLGQFTGYVIIIFPPTPPCPSNTTLSKRSMTIHHPHDLPWL